MGMEKITSTANPQVRQLIQLQKKARLRKEEDVFTVEGIKMYQEVPMDRLVHSYVSESFFQRQPELFCGREKNLTTLSPIGYLRVCLIQRRRRAFCVWYGSLTIRWRICCRGGAWDFAR